MKSMRPSILLITFSCIVACTNSSTPDKVQLRYIKINIALPSDQLNLYPIGNTFNEQGINYFAGYHYLTHRIDIFNLDQKKFIKSYDLMSEGPNAINGLETFTALATDTFYIKTHNTINQLIKSSIYKSFEINPNNFKVVGDIVNGLAIDRAKNIYLNTLIIDNNADLSQVPLFVSIDFKSRNSTTLEPKYPKIVSENFYGDKKYPKYIVKNDSIIYNFGMSSKIFVFNLISGENSTIDAPSSFTRNTTPPISKADYASIDKRVNYHLNQLSFYSLKYNSKKRLYFRLHQDAVEDKKKITNNLFMTVMDKNFKIIKEIKLPPGCKPLPEIYSNGILLPIDPKSEQYLSFLYIEIQ